MSVYFLRKSVICLAQLNIICNFLSMSGIYGATQLSRTLAALSRVTVYHSQYQAGSVDERHHHRPSSLPEKYEIRRRRCTSEGARSAFASCGCDPSSTGSPARRSDSGVPFRGGLAQQNVQSYEHLIKFHPFK